MSTPVLLCYVDNSNIFHEGQRLAGKNGENQRDFRIHFEHFVDIATRGTKPTEMLWGGSTPPSTDSVWASLKAKGIKYNTIPRAADGENETVDHKIQLQMYRHTRKYRSTPGEIVVCTGDGKGYANEEGFLYDLEAFVEQGWKIRVVSWSHSCHKLLRKFAEEHGEFIALDSYYNYVTFVEHARRATSVSMAAPAAPTALAQAFQAAQAASSTATSQATSPAATAAQPPSKNV